MSKRRNILFLFADQLRADFLGCYGADFAKTPNIDALARRGVLYRRAVSPSPLCVPARASLLTGYNAVKTGVFNNNQWLRPDHDQCGMKTWAQKLTEAGFHTGAIGKMHFYPWDISEGFQHRVIAEDKRHIYIKDDYYHYLQENGFSKYHARENPGYFEGKGAALSKIPGEHQVDPWVAKEVCRFLRGHDESKPFALMAGFPGPHCPYDPPREYADLFDPRDMPESIPETMESKSFKESMVAGNKGYWHMVDYSDFSEDQKKKVKAYYSALVSQIDAEVGRIMECLKETGLYENTIIIFSSDHGDYLGDFGFVGKGHFFDPSIHVPLMVFHPHRNGGEEVNSLVSLIDIHNTILEFAGLEPLESSDSITLPMFNKRKERRQHLFAASSMGFMVQKGSWKYCRYTKGLTTLHDMEADPKEQHNLVSDEGFRDGVKELEDILFHELFESLKAANSDKYVDRNGLIGEGAFGERGWKRTYPESLSRAYPKRGSAKKTMPAREMLHDRQR